MMFCGFCGKKLSDDDVSAFEMHLVNCHGVEIITVKRGEDGEVTVSKLVKASKRREAE